MLNEAAIQAKVDPLENLKENVICGHLIPGGTGLRDYDDLVVGSKADLESLQQAQKTKGGAMATTCRRAVALRVHIEKSRSRKGAAFCRSSTMHKSVNVLFTGI